MLALVNSRVQKGSSAQYPGGYIVSQGKSESATTSQLRQGTSQHLQVLVLLRANSSLSSFRKLNDLTINGAGQVGLNTPQVHHVR